MDYDVIVVGCGPAGASAAYFNAEAGRKVLLIEKAEFPRDKICGDGVTGKSLGILYEMGLDAEIAGIKEISCDSVLLSSPNQTMLTIPISSPDDPLTAFCIERLLFDNVLYERAVESVVANGGTLLKEKVSGVVVESDVVTGVRVKDKTYSAKLVVGADGFNGPVSRHVMGETQQPKQNRNHYSSAVREYWEGIKGSEGQIEIHFIKGILPGYFWIFPLSDKRFNIGVGMLLADMDNQSVKLKEMLDWVVNESFLADRFSDAKAIPNTRKGWMLPMGSPRGLSFP